jgi:hypothetical protein
MWGLWGLVVDDLGARRQGEEMMDTQQFERSILRLAFETDTRLTTASVAYVLGVPTREANRMLNELLESGVLELDSDEVGNLFYVVANQGEAAGPVSTHEPARAHPGPPEVLPRPSALSGMLVSTTDEDDAPALSPGDYRPGEVAVGTAPPRDTPQAPVAARGGWTPPEEPQGGSNSAWAHVSVRREDTSRAGGRGRDVLVGVTSTGMEEADAWVGNYGASNVIVADTARCEPKPLSDSRPTLVSCVDASEERRVRAEHTTSTIEQAWWEQGVQPQAGAMVLASNHNLPATMQDLEQPEHQPGMALLLSLILCGTGQIYNGEVSKGIMMMALCFLLWFVLLGWVVHIWSIVDAVVVAERINRRQHA